MRAKLSPVPTVALEPEITVIDQAPMQIVQGTQALIWTDIPATCLRQEIRQHFRRRTHLQSILRNCYHAQ
jgi:hypothetical protein